MLPTDQELTKLRILMERKQRELQPLLEELDRARRAVDAVNSQRGSLWWKFHMRSRELGYCSQCEKRLEECKCQNMGGAG